MSFSVVSGSRVVNDTAWHMLFAWCQMAENRSCRPVRCAEPSGAWRLVTSPERHSGIGGVKWGELGLLSSLLLFQKTRKTRAASDPTRSPKRELRQAGHAFNQTGRWTESRFRCEQGRPGRDDLQVLRSKDERKKRWLALSLAGRPGRLESLSTADPRGACIGAEGHDALGRGLAGKNVGRTAATREETLNLPGLTHATPESLSGRRLISRRATSC